MLQLKTASIGAAVWRTTIRTTQTTRAAPTAIAMSMTLFLGPFRLDAVFYLVVEYGDYRGQRGQPGGPVLGDRVRDYQGGEQSVQQPCGL